MVASFKRLLLTSLPIILLLVLIGGGWLFMKRSAPIPKLAQPAYLSFPGNYVFSVPKDMAVDEQSVPGMQLVYRGVVTGKTLEQIYEINNISLQPITLLKDNKPANFKNYINDTFVPGAKKVLSSDVSTTFTKVDGWDVARVTVKKDGKPLRFIYLKNGQHPVAVISKEETEDFKKIEQSIRDVEKTDLKADVAPLKELIQKTAQQIKDKNSKELYEQAAPEFRTINTEDQISKLLALEEIYSQGAIVINGGTVNGNEFGAVINFGPLNKDFKPASGALYFIKLDGQWKLKGMQLPVPNPGQ